MKTKVISCKEFLKLSNKEQVRVINNSKQCSKCNDLCIIK